MADTVYGPKFERALTTTQIAARFRADVKAAMARGELPRVTLHVRTKYFSGGSSIDVDVVAVPAGFPVLNAARTRWEAAHPHDFLGNHPDPELRWRHAERTRTLLEQLGAMLNAYNYDGSDIQSDYFNVRFYGHVNIAHRLEQAERARILETRVCA